MLFVRNHIPFLCGLSNSFSNSFIDVHSCEVVSSSGMKKNEAYSFDRYLFLTFEKNADVSILKFKANSLLPSEERLVNLVDLVFGNGYFGKL